MAEMSSAHDVPHLSSTTSSARRAMPNVSSGWIVMLLSGLLAMVLFFVATNAGSDRKAVAVVTRHVEPGQPITAAALREGGVSVDGEQLQRMVGFSDIRDVEGWIATSPLEPGDIVMRSSLRDPAAADGRRAMSIPVERSHAVGGDLQAGDRVDVIDSNITPASYVAQNIEVLSVNTSSSGSLGGSSEFSLTLAVEADIAVKLSNTLKGGNFDVIRSTGATPIRPVTP